MGREQALAAQTGSHTGSSDEGNNQNGGLEAAVAEAMSCTSLSNSDSGGDREMWGAGNSGGQGATAGPAAMTKGKER